MASAMTRDLRIALVLFIALSILCGLVYPVAMTGIAEGVFTHQANGSLIERDGVVVGSELIGQRFTGPGYFHGRPSAAGDGYDASASSGSNLGPTSAVLVERVAVDAAAIRSANGLDDDAPLPVDAVTTSASGLDPHISPAYARLQAARVAQARGLSLEEVLGIIEDNAGSGPLILGEPGVNVLALNLALDAREARP